MAKLNLDNGGLVQFIPGKSQVRHRFTRYTYTLTDEDKKGLLNINQVKIVQNYSETNVCLKEIGKKWTFNIGCILRNQSVPLVSPTEAPSRRRMPNKKSASLVAIEDKNEACEEPPSPV